ncbi:RINT-1 family protein [Coprinopsis marcescibilis]|uniref:RINT-1 family protein n=1 Tax=Coprinopsis marcescibilis TaxID=230819 RepID=A0A5C3LD95_COPMA|nr:RINT-1 family protein [Coprinopsis marcescibilis]
MASSELKSLLAPSSSELSLQRATDILNARFTSIDDLDGLELLAADAQSRQAELNAQLSSSRLAVYEFLKETRDTTASLLNDAKEYSLERHTLADELSELSRSLVSVMSDGESTPTLLEDLQTLQRNLKELESVRNYVLIIRHALKLREDSVNQLATVHSISSQELDKYDQLLQFVLRVSGSLAQVEDAGRQLHLVTFLRDIQEKTWRDMKSSLFSTLLESAEKLGWPTAIDYATCDPDTRRSFERAFMRLLHLRRARATLYEKHDLENSEGGGLYPIEALVQPIALRFKYHFEGTRQTNRLDKPEWYFTHILNIAHEHRHFMDTSIQRLLSTTSSKRIVAWREFAMLLLPLLSRKLKKSIPSLLSRPSLFAHTIHQALIFDTAYTEQGFALQSTSADLGSTDSEAPWEGVSGVILGNPEWFSAWVHAEKNFVENQFTDIISASDAWIVSDDADEEATSTLDIKPTNSARRIKGLVNQITDRFSPLPSPAQRAQFLISMQLPLLDSYRGRIASSLDAFETLSNAFLRAVPGALSLSLSSSGGTVKVDSRNLTTGVAGVQRLCKALVSALYIHSALESWSEDTFFLELWQDILRDPLARENASQSQLLPKPSWGNTGGQAVHDTIFDEIRTKYQTIIGRAEDMIVQQVCGEIEAELRPHIIASTHSATGQQPSDGIGISQTLLGPIALLSSLLMAIRSGLPQKTFTNLYRRVASRLAEHILQRQVLYRGDFSKYEGVTVQAECELWVETCHNALSGNLGGGRQRVEAPWSRLLQAARLVGAEGDTWDLIIGATFGTHDEAEWEQVMIDVTGANEMSREDVSKLLRRREDCP